MGKKLKISINTAKQVMIAEIISNLYKGVPYNTVYLEGTMGIGKSSSFRQVKKFMEQLTNKPWGLVDMRFATLSASDIQGIPHPVKQPNGEYVMEWMKDKSLPGINPDLPEYGIILMDEINQVKDPAVKSIMYQFILEKKINDYKLPDKWYQGCAGNREEDGGIYDRLLAPVRDRMMILELEVNDLETLNYFKENNFHPSVINYIERSMNRGLRVLHTYDPDLETNGDEECENYVFCTPRTWEFVSNVLKSHELMLSNGGEVVKQVTSQEVLKARLCGLMGEEAGTNFWMEYNVTADINIDDIVRTEWQDDRPVDNNKLKMRLNKEQLSYLINLVSSTNSDEDIMKLIIYALYVNADRTTIMVMLNGLSSQGQNKLQEYLIVNNCIKFVQKLSTNDINLTINV